MLTKSLTNGSIRLFDQFEKSDEELLRIAEPIEVIYKSEYRYITLIVTKSGVEKYRKIGLEASNITISDIKKLARSRTILINLDKINDLLEKPFKYIPNISLPVYKLMIKIADTLDEEELTDEQIFYFDTMVALNAQSSFNRTGYGWEWDWTNGNGFSSEGTFYGETNVYPIVGVRVDCNEYNANH